MVDEKTEQRPVCDVCGKPATSACVDVIHGTDSSRTWVRSKPIGPTKYGCDEHPAKCNEHETGEVL